MKKRWLFLIFFILTATQAAALQIIVNRKNSISEIKKKDLKNIYMQRKKIWPGGGIVVPVNLQRDNSVRKDFSENICGKSASAVETYYLRRALSGRGQPPKTFTTEKEIIEFVSLNEGAIGYVSKASSSVKIIQVK